MYNGTFTDSQCISTMHRQPSNSKEIYTSIDYENDVIKQLFTCYVGFSSPLNTDDVSKVFIHRTCELGVWKPNYEIDCVPSELDGLSHVIFTTLTFI